jgi:catechol 2,3-dioxygenase-like lactoylglutathione lyase family enzyme
MGARAPGSMQIDFLATIAVVTPDVAASRGLYEGALGLALEGEGDYRHTEALDGVRHFGVWPLSQAAEACFGTTDWPAGRPVPQVSIEFDVAGNDQVAAAAQELERAGHELLHAARTEPWGQTVARLQSPEGAIVGISYTPALRDPS